MGGGEPELIDMAGRGELGVDEDNAFKEWMDQYVNVPRNFGSTQSKVDFHQSGFTPWPAASTNSLELNPHYFTSPFNLPGKPTLSCSAFHLMEIVSDKQDLSFVQKVQVSELQIAHLCNALVPASARVGPDGKITHLNFDALDTLSATVVGFFGDKAIMSKIFRKKGLAPSDFLGRMEANHLKHGLYVCHNGDGKVYLLYWDQRDQATEASRKDVTCNFVRYLVELCEIVYVCLDGKAMEELTMPCVTSVPTRRQRTQRLQIAARRESEDDLKLLDGFCIQLPCNQCRGHQLPRGLHRCSILAGALNAHKLVSRKGSKTETREKLKEFLSKDFANYLIDCTQLPSKDFLLLLEILGKAEDLCRYKSAEITWKQRAEESEKMLQSVDSITKRKKAELLSTFCTAMECYLACKYPWEESSLVDKPQACKAKAEVPSEMGSSLARALLECEEEQVTTVNLAKKLLVLERRLCFIWSDSESESNRFLFPGQVEMARVQENGPGCASCKIVSISIDHKARPGPIYFGQPVVLTYVRNAEPDSHHHTAYFSLPNAGSASGPLQSEPIIVNGETNLSLTSVIGNKKTTELVSIKHLDHGASGMEAWLDAICNVNKPLSLQRQAAAASYLIKTLHGKPLEDKLLEKLLREGSLKEWPKLLPKQAASSLVEFLQEKKVEAFDDQVTACCAHIYKDVRQKLWTGVDTFITQDICPALHDRVRKDIKRTHYMMNRTLDVEKETLVCKMKAQLLSVSDSAIDGDERREFKLRLTSVVCPSSGWWSWSSLLPVETKMTIRYTFEELEKETITWKATEMVPGKADLDELTRAPSSGQVVIPVCSGSVDVITLNPRLESLSGVLTMKSGEALIFVEASDKSYLHLYHCPRLGVSMGGRNPIKVFKRGFDLWAVDEVSRFLAMYDRNLCSISIFRFDEAFKNADWAGVDIQLSQYSGSSNIVWMDLVPGKRELLLLDDQNRLRACEITASMMKPRCISLPRPFIKACITPDSSCLIVFTTQRASGCNQNVEIEYMETADLERTDADSKVSFLAYVYLLDDSLTLLKCLHIESMHEYSRTPEEFQVICKYFGTQMHLVFLSCKNANIVLMSHVLEISSAQQSFQLQKISHKPLPFSNDDHDNGQKLECSSCPALDYIFHIFDKYAISPPLCNVDRNVRLCILLNPPCEQWESGRAKRNCEEHVASSLQKLKEKGKILTKVLQLQLLIQTLDNAWNTGQSNSDSSIVLDCESIMGEWVQKMLCLVPLQIARAENNALKLLINGLEIPADAAYSDAVSLASLLRFGLYDLVLASWKGEVKVVSSMGKQSSGKSYLLNHLAGGLLDVAGGRCTDGVWMTVRREPDCLYVLLDFEGLGSFERSEQEDMFLSILNAAVSNVTIFNKKDFHLDKETEAIFQRFQDGVSLVKADEKLFKGLFYMAIKDVDASDVEDLKNEFCAKINHICSKSSENFLTTMYGGEVEIAALPPFQRPEFQESIADIGYTIQETRASYSNGQNFVGDLKLVMAQISARDWSPIDFKRMAMRLSILYKHLEAAIRLGQCCDGQCLLHFDNQEEIKDRPVWIKEVEVDSIPDAGLALVGDANESRTMQAVLEPLRLLFESLVHHRQAGNDEKWHEMYQEFLASLIERRKDRVLEWLQLNCQDFEQDGDVQKLTLEATAKLADIKSKLVICSCKCKDCFLRCVLGKGHQSDHSCLGSHACSQQCSYCVEGQDSGLMVLECNDLAGHDGPHDCKQRTHTCGKPCRFSNKSSNCNKLCSLRVDHDGEHRCNSRQHMCKEKCTLPQCTNACATPIEFEHEQHACHEKFCPVQCSMEGCTRSCVQQDHFHQLEAGARHFCANEHPCPMKCTSPGVCNVLTELLKQTRSFHGKRSDFEYEYVSEQSEERKGCCLMIPAFQLHHAGPHTHTTKASAVHYCDQRCPACDYYCHLPIGHAGLHKTVHGNMRKMKFVSEVEEIDVLDRRYARGESGVAEMCNMHCKARGRGHIHLTPCPEVGGVGCCTEKLFDGARHLKIKCSGLNVDVPLDEMTHEAYWQYIRFVDPCEEEEKENFALCDHFCRSDEHDTQAALINAGKSYCTEKLWHAPVPRGTFQTGSAGGYVTEDGHHFTCDHSRIVPHNVIFVIDKSGSMDSTDITPNLAKFTRGYHMNRLGCVFEALVRFIKTRMQATVGLQQKDSVSVVLFDTVGSIAVKLDEICEQVVDKLLHYRADGGTTYSAGLLMVEQILGESRMQPEEHKKGPMVIFLSDGGNNGGSDPVYMVRRMKQNEPRLVLHTIMFGHDPHARILQLMAQVGDGTFQLSLDEVQLARSFEGLAKSLKPKVAALCSSLPIMK